MSIWTVLKDLREKKLPARKYFFISTKKGKIGDDGKKSDGHISFKDYLTYEKVWDKFDIKDMGDYHIIILKKMYCYWQMLLKSLLIRAWNFMGLILVIILVLLDWVGMLC